jgi:hypothetical protein
MGFCSSIFSGLWFLFRAIIYVLLTPFLILLTLLGILIWIVLLPCKHACWFVLVCSAATRHRTLPSGSIAACSMRLSSFSLPRSHGSQNSVLPVRVPHPAAGEHRGVRDKSSLEVLPLDVPSVGALPPATLCKNNPIYKLFSSLRFAIFRSSVFVAQKTWVCVCVVFPSQLQ